MLWTFLFEHCFDASFVVSSFHRTNDLLAVHLPVLQEDHSRQARDFILFGKRLFLVEINFQDDRPASILFREIFEDRREFFAGVSPVGIKVQ